MPQHCPTDFLADVKTALEAAAAPPNKHKRLSLITSNVDFEFIHSVAFRLQNEVVMPALSGNTSEGPISLREAAATAYLLYRALPQLPNNLASGIHILRLSALSVIGGRRHELHSWYKEIRKSGKWAVLVLGATNLIESYEATAVECWLRLMVPPTHKDRDAILIRVAGLKAVRRDYDEEDGADKYIAAHPELQPLECLVEAALKMLAVESPNDKDSRQANGEQVLAKLDKAIELCQQHKLVVLDTLIRLLRGASLEIIATLNPNNSPEN